MYICNCWQYTHKTISTDHWIMENIFPLYFLLRVLEKSGKCVCWTLRNVSPPGGRRGQMQKLCFGGWSRQRSAAKWAQNLQTSCHPGGSTPLNTEFLFPEESFLLFLRSLASCLAPSLSTMQGKFFILYFFFSFSSSCGEQSLSSYCLFWRQKPRAVPAWRAWPWDMSMREA